MKSVNNICGALDGCSITDADFLNHSLGQSVLEFLIMFPFLIGLTLILIRVNTAIQIAIVDQQYARAQALFLTYNNAWYPELSKVSAIVANQYVVGVCDNQVTASSVVPQATEQSVTRMKSIVGNNDPQQEPEKRALVRVRDTVTLCTPVNFLGAGMQPILPLDAGNNALGPSALNELTQMGSMCQSGVNYEQ